MRKRLLLLLSILLSFSLLAAACGDDDDEGTDAEDTSDEGTDAEDDGDTTDDEGDMAEGDGTAVKACLVTDLAGIDDKSFNATAWKGVTDAIENGDALPEGPDGSFYLESDTEADWQPNIDQMVSQGCEHIVTVGFALDGVTQANAPSNPDIDWTIVDVDFVEFDEEGNFVGDIAYDNVRELTYQTDEAAFLAGYVAASVTQSGVVGTFGGANFPTVSIFMDGFYWGVEHYNETKGTDVQVLGWDPANPDTGLFTGDFVDLDIARNTAQSLLDEGADVIMPVGGQINLGAAAAMEDLGMGASGDTFGALIGVDTDAFFSAPEQADLWLTSVEKAMDLTVAESIAASAAGEFESGVVRGFLSNGGVGISPYHEFEDIVTDETKAEVEQLEQDIIDGTLVVGG
ncbi:MAG: BMP family ABC transporter substrate-binding protein [Acidimicrobiales bacterium]